MHIANNIYNSCTRNAALSSQALLNSPSASAAAERARHAVRRARTLTHKLLLSVGTLFRAIAAEQSVSVFW